MSRVEVEFINKTDDKLSLPLWLADDKGVCQVIYVKERGYIAVDPLDTQENPYYVYYSSPNEIIKEFPELKPVNVKIVVS